MKQRTVKTILGEFDADRARRFKKSFENAVSEKKKHFLFDGSIPVDTGFARYMIEYLTEHSILKTNG